MFGSESVGFLGVSYPRVLCLPFFSYPFFHLILSFFTWSLLSPFAR